jgi:hypothetical protein
VRSTKRTESLDTVVTTKPLLQELASIREHGFTIGIERLNRGRAHSARSRSFAAVVQIAAVHIQSEYTADADSTTTCLSQLVRCSNCRSCESNPAVVAMSDRPSSDTA